MKKRYTYLIATILPLVFTACNSSSNDTTDNLLTSGYPVVVERGPVYDCNVTDSEGKIAIQVGEHNNTYIFKKKPKFPIRAHGGWIDVDRDGNLTEKDYSLDINLSSYGDTLTPTTTFFAENNETDGEELLEELAKETNTTIEELLTVPSQGTKNSIIVLNAVYEKLIERKNDHSNAPLAIKAILERYQEILNNTNLDDNTSSLEMASSIEEETMLKLHGKGLIKKLDKDDIKKIKDKKPKKIKDDDEEESEYEEEDEEKEESEYEEEHEDEEEDNNSTTSNI